MAKGKKSQSGQVGMENLQRAISEVVDNLINSYEESFSDLIINFIQNLTDEVQFLSDEKRCNQIITDYIRVFGRSVIISSCLDIVKILSQSLDENYVVNNLNDILAIIANELDKRITSDRYIASFKIAMLTYVNTSQKYQDILRSIVGIDVKDGEDDDFDLPF